ncbi:Fic/DOC family N-terminal domain-containing protein [Prosthecomicrobium pneumaticum]|uniref:Fic family protein n=1 Tax=Prosthecomicrobium pneumaticum TaxID=81895 RepID=A0A7W9FJU8_9HYPH|nr:Fic family protein [Prosthecomicrobium pneumaticum]
MDKAAFERSPSGRLAPTLDGQWGFVPADLPPALDAAAVFNPTVRATQALGELNGILRTLPDPYILIYPLQAKEALTSSSMEGTFTTVDALLLAEAGFAGSSESSDTREVRNYSIALRNAVKSLEEVPLSLRTIRGAHRDLMTGVTRSRGAHVRAGEFKDRQNWIGAATIEAARFVPTPPIETAECLDRLERYIHRQNRNDTPAILDAALVHYQFETVHPFGDGNGRVGRILIPVMLYERGVLSHPALFVSPVLERRKNEYIDRMFEVSRTGDWVGWIAFFMDVVSDTCRETIATADRLLAMRERYRQSLQGAGRSALLLSVVDRLFTHPVFSIPQLAEHLCVTYPAAQKHVALLTSLDIVEEIEGTSYPKFFAARGVLNTIAGQA